MIDYQLLRFPFGWLIDEAACGSVDSGNKRRKLDAILQHQPAPDGLISVGSVYSSHLLAIAAAARRRKIPSQLIVLAEGEQDVDHFPHLVLARALGAQIHVIRSNEPFRQIEQLKTEFPECRWIPAGGHAESAVSAYDELYVRVCEAQPELREIDSIWVPYGTGTTAAGLARAVHRMGLHTQIRGVSVSRSRDRCMQAAAEFLSESEMQHLMITDQFAGQYSKRSDATEAARLRFFDETGILPDPIYNAKSLSVFFEEVPGKALVLNTGGAYNNTL